MIYKIGIMRVVVNASGDKMYLSDTNAKRQQNIMIIIFVIVVTKRENG